MLRCMAPPSGRSVDLLLNDIQTKTITERQYIILFKWLTRYSMYRIIKSDVPSGPLVLWQYNGLCSVHWHAFRGAETPQSFQTNVYYWMQKSCERWDSITQPSLRNRQRLHWNKLRGLNIVCIKSFILQLYWGLHCRPAPRPKQSTTSLSLLVGEGKIFTQTGSNCLVYLRGRTLF